MSPEKQREIASKGGRAAHEKGTAHEWTADEARSAGRKGGQVSRGGRGRLIVPPEMPTGGPGDSGTRAGRRREPAVSDSTARVVPFRPTARHRPIGGDRHGKTRSRGLGARAGHAAGASAQNGSSATSTAQNQRRPKHRRRLRRGDPTRDDDLLRRHWTVVCADRRGARPR